MSDAWGSKQGRGGQYGGWRGGEEREEEWTGGATTPHPSMLRFIRIAAVLSADRLCSPSQAQPEAS